MSLKVCSYKVMTAHLKDNQVFITNTIVRGNCRIPRGCLEFEEFNRYHRVESETVTFESLLFHRPVSNLPQFSSLKSDSHLPEFFFICVNESPLKMMKNA